MSEEDGFELLVPFVVVKSEGGPYEDDAFCAGFEMGKLYVELAHGHYQPVSMTIRRDNLPQADLVAMKFGRTMSEVASTDPFDEHPSAEWAHVTFTSENSQ